MIPSPDRGAPALVLTSPGGVAAAAAAALAAALELPLQPALADPALDPAVALAACAEGAGGLLPLALDPGAWLGPAGSWAEALGAWRQPSLLLVPAAALAGPAAAYSALLAAAGVPLLGLVQLGGPWDGAARRGDGLPWLGWLPLAEAAPASAAAGEAAGEPALAALELARRLRRRWRDLDGDAGRWGLPEA